MSSNSSDPEFDEAEEHVKFFTQIPKRSQSANSVRKDSKNLLLSVDDHSSFSSSFNELDEVKRDEEQNTHESGVYSTPSINSLLESKLHTLYRESMKSYFRNVIINSQFSQRTSVNCNFNSTETDSDTTSSDAASATYHSNESAGSERATGISHSSHSVVSHGNQLTSPPTLFEETSACEYLPTYDTRLPMPGIFETITIIPTHILSVKEFYARLTTHSNSFRAIERRMNVQDGPPLQRYREIPDEMEKVLIANEECGIQRARVLKAESANEIQVFCLDTGATHILARGNIFHWPSFCNHVPFQAVLCTVVNVTERWHSDIEAIEYFSTKYLNSYISAEVKEVTEKGLTVRLVDDFGYDIGEELHACNLAGLRKNHQSDNNRFAVFKNV